MKSFPQQEATLKLAWVNFSVRKIPSAVSEAHIIFSHTLEINQLGTKVLQSKKQVCFLKPKLIFSGVENAHNRQKNSSNTMQSITPSHFLEVPPTAPSSVCNPQHQLLPCATLQLKEPRDKEVNFNCGSKRSETPITKTMKKVL